MNKQTMSFRRRLWNRAIPALVWGAGLLAGALALGVLGIVLVRGLPQLSWSLLSSVPSVARGIDGILPYLLNTLYIILLSLLLVLPLGVGAAVYLTEYAGNRRLIGWIEFTTETLAGIPSIIYGLVGMLIFSNALGFQSSLLSGSLTLTIMTLPTIIRTTQESLKTVPASYREGAVGLGATKWHVVRTIVLPCSVDGIVTGCILAVGRIVGESAALLFTAGCGKALLSNLFTAYTRSGATLSVALYMYAFEEGNFHVAWAIAAVLLVLVLLINLLAKAAQKKLKRKDG
jgi:phosphate transport system permease protein